MAAPIIFLVCVVFFVADIFAPAIVALAGCTAMVLFDVCSAQDAFSGFTNDIIFIVFGTEIFGIAFQESGLSTIVADSVIKYSHGKEKRIILIGGIFAAVLSAFINNMVVSSIMLIICISIAKSIPTIKLRNITLPIMYMVIFGGQCTLIGAPATLVASSMSENMTGQGIGMFEILPMGLIILIVGTAFIYFFNYKLGDKIWGNEENIIKGVNYTENTEIDRKKCIVTCISGAVMIFLFITEMVSVGIASIIGALICLVGGAVNREKVFSNVDWNIIIWLGCTLGIADALNQSGIVQKFCNYISVSDISPVLLMIIFVIITIVISNLTSNTSTVIMILPFAVSMAEKFGFNSQPFIISIAMAASLSIMTPLSCAFIGITMRVGYRFKDYLKYGALPQVMLAAMITICICVMYNF